jgi:hypothetical protein
MKSKSNGLMLQFLFLMTYLFFMQKGNADQTALNLGHVAQNFLEPAGMFVSLGYKLCYLIGGALLIGTAFQYKMYRNNPMQVRLGQVLFLLFFGLVMIGIPLIAEMSSASKVFGN